MNSDEVRQLNESLVEVHAKRLADLGSDASGLFNHYATLVGEGTLVRRQELDVLKLIATELPAFEEYVVLRANLGELALLLERFGLRTQACEANGLRFKALVSGVDRIARRNVPDDRRMRAVAGYLPDAVRARPALAVTLDFGYNAPLENDAEFERRLRQFAGILFDPRSFIRYRPAEPDQEAGIEYLRSLGFSGFKKFAHLNLIFATLESSAVPVAAKGAPAIPSTGGGFGGLVERVMSLVPESPQVAGTSTWVDRRVRHFDMKSAFGNGE